MLHCMATTVAKESNRHSLKWNESYKIIIVKLDKTNKTIHMDLNRSLALCVHPQDTVAGSSNNQKLSS